MKKWLAIGFASLTISLSSANLNWDDYVSEVLSHQANVPGWCTYDKAQKMMELIQEAHPTVCVEIGVFGGSSIYPTASALRYLGKGTVYAIDPWSNEECLKGYSEDDPNYIWWSQVDLEKIFTDFNNMLEHFGLTKFCDVLRMNSIDALSHFQDESIDVLHIDGNHTEQIALRDIQMYLPKLKKGGYLWFDDVNWTSTNKAVQYASEHCDFEYAVSNNSCILFKKN